MKVGKMLPLLCLILVSPKILVSQNLLDMDHIWTNGTFSPKQIEGIYWFKDSESFAGLNGNRIMKFKVDGEEKGQVLLDGDEMNLQISEFSFDQDEGKILFLGSRQKIWRYSYVGEFFLFDLKLGTIAPLSNNGKQSYAGFSPDGKKVSFVRNNNLFVKFLEKDEEKQISLDGNEAIINGSSDWLYEEEFKLTRAYCWSPESDKIAYIKFNQEAVPTYPIQKWEGNYSQIKDLRYSKAGEKISEPHLIIHHLEGGKEIEANLGKELDFYLPSLQWTYHNDIVSVIRLNRNQSKLELIHVGANSGMAEVILIDASKNYVDFNYLNQLTYLDDGNTFIYPSEKMGFKHFFHFEMSGKFLGQVTSGDWEVDEMVRVDSKSGSLYFTSTEDGPTERQFYQISLKGKKKAKISSTPGWHEINMSPDGKYFLDFSSSLSSPPSLRLFNTSNAKEISTLEDNSELLSKANSFGLVVPELIKVATMDSLSFNGYVIKPKNMDSGKKYPVLMYVYGGPGSQKVKNSWQFTERELWHQYMVAKGYIVYCFDNRGTMGRGVPFKKQTFENLGKMESEDQIMLAKEIGKLPFVDPARIGIWGWSYGGFMSSICKFQEPTIFKTAVAVAPVSHWKFYNAAYTERYMEMPENNPQGYENFCPLNLADKLEGNYLLIHAAEDDNVHLQNSMELAQKLIEADKQFDFFIYPKGAHSINEGSSRKNVYQKIAEYLIDNL